MSIFAEAGRGRHGFAGLRVLGWIWVADCKLCLFQFIGMIVVSDLRNRFHGMADVWLLFD